ncbi:hypothetical protein N9172_00460 [bacterium]|nr:hypothetical protein [Pseudomonadales bacterium]MDB4408383.1 hypothetical protein [bacterium]
MKRIIIILSVLVIYPVYANDQEQLSIANSWRYSVFVSETSFDSDLADKELIEDSATTFGVDADYYSRRWMSSVGLEFISYDDNNGFSQLVEGTGLFNDGDVSTESSDANAFALNVATGAYWSFGARDKNLAIVQVGFSEIFNSERSIDNCDDCFKDDIDVDGGAFAKVGLVHSWSALSVGLHVKQYLSGDIDNSILISFGSGL